MKQILANKFPAGYWGNWDREFGHNFFDTHIARTIVYADMFGSHLTGKRILEVGGFPGLAMAMYEEFNPSHITAVDHPDYSPGWYTDWAQSRKIEVVKHDISKGEPNIRGRWDIAVMSDVLLHVDGFPVLFFGWMLRHCSKVYMINFEGSVEYIKDAVKGDLKSGFPICRYEIMSTLAKAIGGDFESLTRVDDRRQLLILKGVE